ncbi:hypothetical protein I79_004634 [Cricetulus griseus]|uniref:Uncharacterized protein n=1 Tax=Cricetulus griseus TaxID=10029 RepID=G3H327_CRIGR|nr:hypothetical protein I79_004634 [Cricetulus griseus]
MFNTLTVTFSLFLLPFLLPTVSLLPFHTPPHDPGSLIRVAYKAMSKGLFTET